MESVRKRPLLTPRREFSKVLREAEGGTERRAAKGLESPEQDSDEEKER